VGLLDIEEGSTVWSPAPGSGQGRSIRVNATEAVVIKGEDQAEAPWRNKTAPLYTGMHTDVFVDTDGDAGDIFITSPLIRITNSGQIGARTYTDGRGGVITVDAGRIELLSGGEIAADSFGPSLYQGPAGDVVVRASESILIKGRNDEVRSGFSSSTRSDADAGRITINTPHLTIEEEGVIMTATGVFGTGGAGRISIDAGRVDLRSGGGISSSSSGYGDKGTISVTASEGIMIDGGYIVSFGSSSGKAGDISLTTPVLSMAGGQVSTIAYEDLDAGNVIIETSRTLLSGGARISSESDGYGNAGQVRITASDLLRSEASSITTAASFATGGNIQIQAGDIQILDGTQVTATVAGGTGNGGNVTIHARTLAGLGNSDITARADQGFGGNITIGAEVVLLSKDCDLNASSNVVGQEGTVAVNAPRVDVGNNLAVLPESLLDINAFLPKRCAAREDEVSTFVVKGRDGIPPQPYSLVAGQ
jgi:large exoprotein involved in heme utilization and adhesion